MGSRSRRSFVDPTALSLSNAQRKVYSPSNAFPREAIGYFMVVYTEILLQDLCRSASCQ